MSTGYHKCQQWKFQIRNQPICIYMSGYMMNRYQWLMKCPGKRLSRLHTDMQTAYQTRSLRNSDRINVFHRDVRFMQCLLNYHRYVFHMNSACNLWNNTTKFLMYINLCCNDIGQNLFSIRYNRHSCFITTGFHSQYECLFHTKLPPRALHITMASSPLSL